MIMLSTLAASASLLTQPVNRDAQDPGSQILMHCSLIVVKDADLLSIEDAEKDDSVFTIRELRLSDNSIFTSTTTLDIGDAKVVFSPRDGKIDIEPSKGRASIISSPRVLALDGQEASISIGNDVTIIESMEGPDEEGFCRVKFGSRMEGVKVSFTGNVAKGGIRMEPMNITVSSLQGGTRHIGWKDGAVQGPVFAERKLESILTLPPDSLAILPIASMPDDSGYLLAAISAKAVGP